MIALTDHITGDHRLVPWAAHVTDEGGTLVAVTTLHKEKLPTDFGAFVRAAAIFVLFQILLASTYAPALL